MSKAVPSRCQLCQRPVALTFHHLIPKKVHRRARFRKNYDREQLQKGIFVCRRCHRGLHRLFNEMTLAQDYDSLEKLLADEQVQKHVAWVAKQKEQR